MITLVIVKLGGAREWPHNRVERRLTASILNGILALAKLSQKPSGNRLMVSSGSNRARRRGRQER